MAVRITIACPDAHRADANALSACLGFSLADAQTYGEPTWRDAGGNLYACASLDVREEWLSVAQEPLARPKWDKYNEIDMQAANAAQTLIKLWIAGSTPQVPQPSPAEITVIAGMAGVEAIAAMKLSAVEE